MATTNDTVDENVTADALYRLYAVNDYTVIALYIPLYLGAMFANILVIIVVFKDKLMRSVTNYFLVNLAVADLLVTMVCMPNAAWRAYTSRYIFGEYTCKIVTYLQCISVASSIFTIAAMALDRWLAISTPFGIASRCFTKKSTVLVIIFLWFLSLVLFSPILWIYSLQVDTYPEIGRGLTMTTCVPRWDNFFISQYTLGIVWFIFMFAKPGIIMVFTYSMMGKTLCRDMPDIDNDSEKKKKVMKARKRIACILLLLSVLFFLCWLPYHIRMLIDDIASAYLQINDTRDALSVPELLNHTYGEVLTSAWSNHTSTDELYTNFDINRYLLLLGHANSALNPIIYCALSQKFRNSIKDLLGFSDCLRRNRRCAGSINSVTQMKIMSPFKCRNNMTLSSHLQSSQRQKHVNAV